MKATISQVLDSWSSLWCNFVVEVSTDPARRVFDLTFESHRSTHTILEFPRGFVGLPSWLDAEGLSEREERGTTTTPLILP